MVVDNLLMSGEVALPEDAETWLERRLARVRAPPQQRAAQLGALARLRASGGRRNRRRGAALGPQPITGRLRSSSSSLSAFCILPVTSS